MAISNFATEVLADGPIGYWRLGEALGSVTAADASGNLNNGTCSGGITFGQPGFHGGDTAALFDGKTGRTIVLNSNSLNPPHITMEAKVRWDGPNDYYQRILEKSSFPELAQYGLGILARRACACGAPHKFSNNQRQRRQHRRGRAGRGDPCRGNLQWQRHSDLSQRRSGQRDPRARQHLSQAANLPQPHRERRGHWQPDTEGSAVQRANRRGGFVSCSAFCRADPCPLPIAIRRPGDLPVRCEIRLRKIGW